MKCPECQSENFYRSEFDPLIISCDDCHFICSTPYASGYWIGYIAGEEHYNIHCYMCKHWKPIENDFNYGNCDSLKIKTEEFFYCKNWERVDD